MVGAVGTDRHDLRAAIAHLGHPVGVRRSGHRDVGAPPHQIGGVPPVAALEDVGLIAEDLRTGHRQVAYQSWNDVITPPINCVKRVPMQCETIDIAGMGENPATRSGPVSLDRVHVRGGDHLHRLAPRGPDQASLAARLLIATPALRIGGMSAQASTGSLRRVFASRYISSGTLRTYG